jgi:hypothetical protein
MRGKDEQQLDVFSYLSPEQRVPQDHPLRPLRVMVDEALRGLQPRFSKLYAKTGRPSIAPEKFSSPSHKVTKSERIREFKCKIPFFRSLLHCLRGDEWFSRLGTGRLQWGWQARLGNRQQLS